jgi:hypothetical protein
MSNTKPTIPADQKRALSDYACATRKLAALFRSKGWTVKALWIEGDLQTVKRWVKEASQ